MVDDFFFLPPNQSLPASVQRGFMRSLAVSLSREDMKHDALRFLAPDLRMMIGGGGVGGS